MPEREAVSAGIVVTGTEVLNGQIPDANGPWLSERLRELGIELTQITVVGDRRADLLTALEDLKALGVDLLITSGGLGPTADDITMVVVAEFTGCELIYDPALERRIEEILRPLAANFPHVDREAVRAGNHKQSMIPRGAAVLQPVGTAPGAVVCPETGPIVVVLPGPPRELQPLWKEAITTAPLEQLTTKLTPYELSILRLHGVPESEIAQTLREFEQSELQLDQLEITTCLRRGELEIATRYLSTAVEQYKAFAEAITARYGKRVFSTDSRTIDELAAGLLEGHSVAVAESCTGGRLAGRITELPGASAYFKGGLVVYSNESKTTLAGVEQALIERFGAVSPEVSALLADGAIDQFNAEIGIGVTGIAGPDGGSEKKPVGYVCISVADRTGARITRELKLPGDRAMVRDRTTTAALQLLRKLLQGETE